MRKPKSRPILDSRLKVGDRVITREDCHTRQAQVDEGVAGIITDVYVSYGTGFNYDVEFTDCIYKGRWTGRKIWCFSEDKLNRL